MSFTALRKRQGKPFAMSVLSPISLYFSLRTNNLLLSLPFLWAGTCVYSPGGHGTISCGIPAGGASESVKQIDIGCFVFVTVKYKEVSSRLGIVHDTRSILSFRLNDEITIENPIVSFNRYPIVYKIWGHLSPSPKCQVKSLLTLPPAFVPPQTLCWDPIVFKTDRNRNDRSYRFV
jgi:hypothetical protein